MSAWLLGVPGALKTLKDRLTSARASNLDEITATRMARLDRAVSSNATQTSVNTVDGNVDTLVSRLTSGRASNLDNLSDLDAPVSAIPTSIVASVQKGTSSMSDGTADVNIPISSVDVAKAFAIVSYNGFADAHDIMCTFRLTSETNLRVERYGGQASGAMELMWQVVEFN